MDIISYVGEEVDSKRERDISKLIKTQKNPVVMMIIKKLSDQYRNYKGSYKFPSKFKSIFKMFDISCFKYFFVQQHLKEGSYDCLYLLQNVFLISDMIDQRNQRGWRDLKDLKDQRSDQAEIKNIRDQINLVFVMD